MAEEFGAGNYQEVSTQLAKGNCFYIRYSVFMDISKLGEYFNNFFFLNLTVIYLIKQN